MELVTDYAFDCEHSNGFKRYLDDYDLSQFLCL